MLSVGDKGSYYIGQASAGYGGLGPTGSEQGDHLVKTSNSATFQERGTLLCKKMKANLTSINKSRGTPWPVLQAWVHRTDHLPLAARAWWSKCTPRKCIPLNLRHVPVCMQNNRPDDWPCTPDLPQCGEKCQQTQLNNRFGHQTDSLSVKIDLHFSAQGSPTLSSAFCAGLP